MPWASAHRPHRAAALLLALLLLAASAALGRATPAYAATSLNAEGSSWAGPAIDQWRQDVVPQGIQINFNPSGSAAGRKTWAAGLNDFVASDVPFRSKPDTGAGGAIGGSGAAGAERAVYGYSYVPITAGGTAFMYNLVVAGKRVTDLRLSSDTLVKIFTGKITYWDDPAITKDYGRALPRLEVSPVVRSDGSGATAQFTRWMQHTHQAEWEGHCKAINGISCGDYTEFYPTVPGMTAQNGSDAVANFIKSPGNVGTIGYDEYAFAKRSNWPVVKVLNAAGYYTLPTASNVAVALTAARIKGVDDATPPSDPNFLQQNLDGVYSMADPRAYPVSSYSYLIVPRQGVADPVPPRFNDAKGNALSKFISYVLCAGQGQADSLGYSPIPRNLVRGGMLQVGHIPGSASPVNPETLANCGNPTFDSSGQLTVLVNAPQPSPCDKAGAPLDCVVRDGKPVSSGTVGTTGGNSGGSSGGSTGGGSTGGGTGGTAGGTAGGTGGDPDAAPPVIDPQTGQVVGAGGSGGGSGNLTASTVEVGNRKDEWLLSTLTALELLAVVAIPPLLGGRLAARRRNRGVAR
ncbi:MULTISPECIES: substrate-binding domain-containing protein [unclassified Kitasatospora]|uniref:substrate-binding domain-containing protein n=1 Tax=unclassified Kitasatospora TaxID=2633591 RepID=UPI0007100DAD|nr:MULTISPECIES: substrate-binding domain-containing protein [unclassified Kitasatospora]KQV09832.1 phosphate ABC transporter substrate-binding protein [Kitasatospora sp. Root107]KRB70071.1 phosphate ABC transporter substrate-binding protein [Kitasatospora sp. Root187]